MITLERDRLCFRFPEIHPLATCAIAFQRTLRVPETDDDHPLPPGLGAFPLFHVDDFAEHVPEAWIARGGVMMPMHQSEALWLNFHSPAGYPFAIKVAAGKINAVTGEAWTDSLNRDPQDYVAIPDQPWLDGYCVGAGTVRQFVAAPLGQGLTVEEQLTGEPVHGGIQLIVYPIKSACFEEDPPSRSMLGPSCSAPSQEMGLAAGGRIEQEIYSDGRSLADWDQRHGSRCFVSILDSASWGAVTGTRPPLPPPSASDYADAGLPWFSYYDEEAKALDAMPALRTVKSAKALERQRSAARPVTEAPLGPLKVVPLRPLRATVREADF